MTLNPQKKMFLFSDLADKYFFLYQEILVEKVEIKTNLGGTFLIDLSRVMITHQY
jgi:hypothetical protein